MLSKITTVTVPDVRAAENIIKQAYFPHTAPRGYYADLYACLVPCLGCVDPRDAIDTALHTIALNCPDIEYCLLFALTTDANLTKRDVCALIAEQYAIPINNAHKAYDTALIHLAQTLDLYITLDASDQASA